MYYKELILALFIVLQMSAFVGADTIWLEQPRMHSLWKVGTLRLKGYISTEGISDFDLCELRITVNNAIVDSITPPPQSFHLPSNVLASAGTSAGDALAMSLQLELLSPWGDLIFPVYRVFFIVNEMPQVNLITPNKKGQWAKHSIATVQYVVDNPITELKMMAGNVKASMRARWFHEGDSIGGGEAYIPWGGVIEIDCMKSGRHVFSLAMTLRDDDDASIIGRNATILQCEECIVWSEFHCSSSELRTHNAEPSFLQYNALVPRTGTCRGAVTAWAQTTNSARDTIPQMTADIRCSGLQLITTNINGSHIRATVTVDQIVMARVADLVKEYRSQGLWQTVAIRLNACRSGHTVVSRNLHALLQKPPRATSVFAFDIDTRHVDLWANCSRELTVAAEMWADIAVQSLIPIASSNIATVHFQHPIHDTRTAHVDTPTYENHDTKDFAGGNDEIHNDVWSDYTNGDYTNGDDVGSIVGFVHIAALGDRWISIVREQLTAILVSETFLHTQRVHIVGTGGSNDILSRVLTETVALMYDGTATDSCRAPASVAGAQCQSAFHSSKFNVTSVDSSTSAWEIPTLIEVAEWCDQHPADTVWYIHNKGASHTWPGSQSVDAWRRYMQHFLIDNGVLCAAALGVSRGGCDICGVDWRDEQHKQYYSGNFWWSKCKHINRLVPPNRLVDAATYEGRRVGDWAEFWLGSGPEYDAMSLWSTKGLFYSEPIDTSEYDWVVRRGMRESAGALPTCQRTTPG